MKRRVLAFTLYLLMVAGVSAGIGWFALTDALDRLEERAGSDLSLASDRLTGQLQRFRELAVGGFNRSSQHPDDGGVDDNRKMEVGALVAWQIILARSAANLAA